MVSSSPTQPNRSGGWDTWAVVALVLAAGWFGHEAMARHRVNWDGLAACASAYRVLYSGARPSLSEIGFAKPPLTALLMTAVGWVDADLLQSGAAAMLMGIASLMVAAMWAVAFMRRLGIAEWVAAALAIVFFGHPLVMSLYVGGSPSAHFLTLALIGLGALAMWMAEMKLRDLIAASVALGLAGLCDHLGLMVAAAATVAVAVRMATAGEGDEPSAPGRRKDGKRLKAAEGAALLFGIVPAYFYGLWVLAGWAIVGTPFQSLQAWVGMGRTHLADVGVLGFVTLACGAWGGAVLLGLAVKEKGLKHAAWATVGVGLAAGVLPIGIMALMPVSFNFPGIESLPTRVIYPPDWATVAPVAMLVTAAVLVTLALVLAEATRGGWWKERGMWRVGGALLLVGMTLTSAKMGLGGGWPATYRGLARGKVGVTGDYAEAQSVARLATWLIEDQAAPAVYVVSRKAPVFAVALAAGDMKRVKDLFMAEVEAGAYEVDYWPGGHGKERSVAMPEPKGWVCRFVMWWGDYAVYRYEAGKG